MSVIKKVNRATQRFKATKKLNNKIPNLVSNHRVFTYVGLHITQTSRKVHGLLIALPTNGYIALLQSVSLLLMAHSV